jgi:glyoxylase-like metal-dependent hydrolase (beta-lactamase superfamily II)
LAANCYIIGAGDADPDPPGADRQDPCVVIDPGQDAASALAQVLSRDSRRPVAVLMTHGHLDHVASAARICRTFDIPAFVHESDAYMLDDPLGGLSPQLRVGISAILGPNDDLAALRPDDLRSLAGVPELSLAGLTIAVDHVPGHTGGSVVYRVVGGADGSEEHLFTGDTLFAGSIGRTDLPGGSTAQIMQSIAEKLLTRPDEAIVHAGHGRPTTIGIERATNPFL